MLEQKGWFHPGRPPSSKAAPLFHERRKVPFILHHPNPKPNYTGETWRNNIQKPPRQKKNTTFAAFSPVASFGKSTFSTHEIPHLCLGMPGKPLSSERTWYSFSTHPGELAQTKGTKTREFGCGLTLTIRSTVDITATTPNQPLGTCHVEKWDDQETSSQLLAWLFKVAKLTSTRKR